MDHKSLFCTHKLCVPHLQSSQGEVLEQKWLRESCTSRVLMSYTLEAVVCQRVFWMWRISSGPGKRVNERISDIFHNVCPCFQPTIFGFWGSNGSFVRVTSRNTLAQKVPGPPLPLMRILKMTMRSPLNLLFFRLNKLWWLKEHMGGGKEEILNTAMLRGWDVFSLQSGVCFFFSSA